FCCQATLNESGDDVPGDLVSQYDESKRQGFQVSLKTSTGVTFNQSNFRHLQFGIDNNRMSQWTPCGKPGPRTLLAFGLISHEGNLYAGTCEPDDGDMGRVYRYGGGESWVDIGSPTRANSITVMASHKGDLYVGSGKYRVAGSALKESTNTQLGGHIYKYSDGKEWIDCGQLPNTEAVSGLISFRGQLYAGSLYHPAGFFRYEGGTTWTPLTVPTGNRVEAICVFNGDLYATSYNQGRVFRFDGNQWTDLGQLGESELNTQTYSFAVHMGRLFVGTWRSGRVYRYEGINQWTDVGRLGEELEVMGMLVHNGRLIAGTLPLAEVYSFDGRDRWDRLTQLDTTPDVKFRRAWTMAEYKGDLYCSTLPSGVVYRTHVGRMASWDHEFPTGWHHIAAVKHGSRLKLFVDGTLKSESEVFNPSDYDLSSHRPIRLGIGSNDYFYGRMRHARLYRRALTVGEIESIAKADKK
ncbi:MAG: LamG domain-containing protein, partial [Planctomycetes bacterium]|nr:LamG domain-containing protein [Planctomycetota bacterium]